MKKVMIICLMALMIFAAAPVMACGSSCGGDKDKDESAFTAEYQTLCGGDKDDKPTPDPDPSCGGGDKKDKDEIKT